MRGGMKAKARFLCWHQNDSISSVTRRATVNLLAETGTRPFQIGTGILFRARGGSYVLTAAHVLEDLARYGKRLIITNSGVGSTALDVDSSTVSLPWKTANLDIACIKLPERAVSEIEGSLFLSREDLDLESRPEEGRLLIVGYPSAGLASFDLGLESVGCNRDLPPPLEMNLSHYRGKTRGLEGYDQRIHMLFSFQKRQGPPGRGCTVMVGFPEGLRGVSGSGVWKVNGKVKLVSIQTGFYERSRLIKSTRASAIIGLLDFANNCS